MDSEEVSYPAKESDALMSEYDERQYENQDDDVVVVLNDGDLQLQHRNHHELQSPLRSVTDVLREAENIMTDGPLQIATGKEKQQVLIDEVDVEYSPRKSCQPIEIVVRHNKIVEHPYSSDDEDNDHAVNLKRKRLSVLREGEESSPSHLPSCSSKSPPTWKRGHRRAWSMPNAKGEKMTLAVIQDNESNEGGNTKRRIVKYRLHPHRAPAPGADVDDRLHLAVRYPNPEDDDNELEVEINEEEVVVPGEEGKGARTIVKRFWEARWKATNFESLPDWLQDNEYLRTGHRPPIPSFSNCFKSIFELHTESGNIWTHMYGCVAFIGVAIWFLTRNVDQVQFMEKVVFAAFFIGAIICLGMSFTFHTLACHSIAVGKLFSKLDYTGITLLIVGSFIPWIYYAFNCRPQPMIIYIFMITVLGIMAMIVSLWDKFAAPKFRPVRAGVFVAMGLSAIVPAAHLLIVDGLDYMMNKAALNWMLLMGGMYIGGATIYATRVPERCFPGKCDIWFQSHQLFHTFVVAAAFIHFHAITKMAQLKLMEGSCPQQLLERYGVDALPSWLGTLLGLDEDPNTINWTPQDVF
ncbi:unnamed protein product [Auanema sp. JU1783]|nr:unnamed protein product [Auanema sp. JU1783]